MMETKEKIWNMLVDLDVATNNEITLVTDINGYTTKTLLDIISARTGLQSLRQFVDEFGIVLEDYDLTEEEIQ